MEYYYSDIEKKWQQYWKEQNTYRVEIDQNKPKYYVLDMFPYPSGSGLHVGHPLGYIATDILSRYKRLNGFNVLHPMGFDAFGLPAEQYAIQTGTHPAKTTDENIKTYKRQLEAIGFSFDWSREVRTSDPKYYKWTQWIFIQLFHSWYDNDANKARSIEELTGVFEKEGNANVQAATDQQEVFTAEVWKSKSEKEQQEVLLNYRLAYLAYADVNWCAELGTVLANDEVKDGVSERGGFPVVKKSMRQWFLRITAYSERLLRNLDKLDWSESMKEMQRNWIGRSEGAQVFFDIEGSDEQIEIFTTRPDTIFGATYMVLAPEHPLVEQLTTIDQKDKIKAYLDHTQSRSERERQAEVKKVTGEFTGTYAINPLTDKKIPIWIGEYVLMGYGTGAIMAVPSDDDRDHAFATKFGLDIIDVIDKSGYPTADRHDKLGKMINSGFLNGMEVLDAIQAINTKLEEMGRGTRQIQYRQRDAGFSRQRYWGEPFPIVYRDGMPYTLDESELPLTLPDVDSYKPTGTGEAPLAALEDWVNLPDGSVRETDTMPGYAGSSWYFLRYMDPDNDERFVGEEAEAYWQNVDFYMGGAEHAVGHLLYARFWQMFLYDRGFVSQEEPFKKLINQGMIQGRSNFVYRVEGTNQYVSNGLKDQYDTTALHVDVNIVENDVLDVDAFKRTRKEYADAEFVLEEGQYICGYEAEKMSKSKYNVVNPDDMIAQYGADTFRMYEMFLGPIEVHKPWNTQGIDGVFKFVRKLWRLFYTDEQLIVAEGEPTPEELKTLHKTIKKVQEDIDRLSFNTCVSAFMVCVNELADQDCHKKDVLIDLVKILSPFAPHLCEELWQVALGQEGSVTQTTFPAFNEEYLKEDEFEYPISINGKMRAKIKLPLDLDSAAVQEQVLANEAVQKWVEGNAPKRFIHVPGRIVNIVI